MRIEFANRPDAAAMVPPDLELEAVCGGLVVGWRDHRSGLAFEWENYDVVGTPTEFHFRLFHAEFPSKIIVSFRFERISNGQVGRTLLYRVSRSDFERGLSLTDADADAVFTAIGKENDLLEFCLKATRVCHLRPLRIEPDCVRVHPRAEWVDFRVVD
ncbi:hypothetical protein HZY97_19085 [Sphingomonas sp. R-74633]|uniref:hypothetical protein n=1 Tax=Sphingomonas sp. R-74633 TaxID=2751188 RepID=UPI0015D2107B|nr:hypothetical protein [Sphingomonas sp. R-74633]NYT42886.1 hypothetical protein [Sphingomonas sp. R-74633]